jgi:hypothetical protein
MPPEAWAYVAYPFEPGLRVVFSYCQLLFSIPFEIVQCSLSGRRIAAAGRKNPNRASWEGGHWFDGFVLILIHG